MESCPGLAPAQSTPHPLKPHCLLRTLPPLQTSRVAVFYLTPKEGIWRHPAYLLLADPRSSELMPSAHRLSRPPLFTGPISPPLLLSFFLAMMHQKPWILTSDLLTPATFSLLNQALPWPYPVSRHYQYLNFPQTSISSILDPDHHVLLSSLFPLVSTLYEHFDLNRTSKLRHPLCFLYPSPILCSFHLNDSHTLVNIPPLLCSLYQPCSNPAFTHQLSAVEERHSMLTRFSFKFMTHIQDGLLVQRDNLPPHATKSILSPILLGERLMKALTLSPFLAGKCTASFTEKTRTVRGHTHIPLPESPLMALLQKPTRPWSLLSWHIFRGASPGYSQNSILDALIRLHLSSLHSSHIMY
nr:uncharacterized protein LOC123284590 isoform X2 [Equus asinus]